jgi:hypothetical protein
MSTPTPRTDAAWAKTFQDDEDQCRAGNAATDMRDECATLERELAALTAERDQLRAENATEREGVRVLRSALENLCDEQNGAPLETRRDQWQLAMDEARAAIVATEGAK